MAKKFVRGITDIKTINNQDFDTNNVNDLLSDGEHNFIHRKKKDKSEEYHNLTNNIKTINSDNADLLSVTNNNNTTNSATLSPKHDKLKEQVIESTRNTIDINYGENGTPETTKVDTNPQKVLEHENLHGNTNYVKVEHVSGNNTTTINSESITEKFNQVDENLDRKQDTIKAINTQTVQMSLISNNLRSNVVVSQQDNNNLSVKNDGLFVPSLTAGSGITIQGTTISATGGLTPQHESFGTRGQSYYAFREVFGQRTTYTIEVVQGEPELTVVGPLKTVLAEELSSVKTVTNGAITLTYDNTDVKIVTNTSQANGVEQATFTFYHQ